MAGLNTTYDDLLTVETLGEEEILRIYDRLVLDFAESDDPIKPAGLRSPDLLASAVSRQHTGIGARLKYPEAADNAATLLFGICQDHPFLNGNKRTALVSMLAHLDKNRMTLVNVGREELFQMIIDVANHVFVARGSRLRRPHGDPDDEVAEIARWINDHLYRLQRGEQQITYRQLRVILGRHGFALENPDGNSIDIVKIDVIVQRRFFSQKTTTERKRITSIPYPGEKRLVGIGLLKHVRRVCQLTEADGCDSSSFYVPDDDANVIDGFIQEYRTVLRRLARR
jgi:death on curing protein